MTVRELQSRMDAREFAEWQAYYSIEPFGESRADLRNAITATVIANQWAKKPHKITEFMPKFDAPKAQSPEVLKSILMGIASGSNKQPNR